IRTRASPTALSSTRRKAGANICEMALMAASIMPADVMPVVAAGKGPRLRDRRESVFARWHKPDDLIGIEDRHVGPGDPLVLEASHNSRLHHLEIRRNVEISRGIE